MKIKQLILIFVFLIPFSGINAANTDIVINEIGAYEPGNYEWIEIYNKGASSVDLEGWKFYENETNHGLSLYQGEDMMIGAGDYAIIADVAENFKDTYPDFNGTIIDSAWSTLRESGEEIALKDSSGEIIESFTYIEAPDFSLERKDFNINDYTSLNWQEHPDSNTAGSENFYFEGGDLGDNTYIDIDPSDEQDSESEEDSEEEAEEVSSVVVVPTHFPIGSVVINEFVSDPVSGEEEWIELFNKRSDVIDLEGWTIEEGGGAVTALSGEINKFFVIENPKGYLNNKGDIIFLKDNHGRIMDQVIYGDWDDNDNALVPKKGESLARLVDGHDTDDDKKNFKLTQTLTRGLKNVIEYYEEVVEEKDDEEIIINKEKDILDEEDLKKIEVVDEAQEDVNKNEDIDSKEEVDFEDKIIINEIFPNPEGADNFGEWIEIKNMTGDEIDLGGFKLDDSEKGSRSYKIPQGVILEANELLIFKRLDTKIALNNTEDRARFFDREDNLIDEVFYGDPIEDFSFARNENGEWKWTSEVTPEQENIIKEEVLENGSKKKKSKTKKTAKVIEVSLAEIRYQDLGDRVRVRGNVLVLPGVLGMQIFYIGNEESGVQIYMHKKNFPNMDLSDLVEVVGELSESRGELRVKIKNKEDIKVLASGEIEAKGILCSDISEDLEGMLVVLEGEILEKKGNSFWLDDGDGEIKVYIKSYTQINKKRINVGDIFEITGIVSEYSGEYRILPRGEDDIKLIEQKIGSVKGAFEKKDDEDVRTWDLEENNKSEKVMNYFIVLLSALIFVSGGMLIKRRLTKK